MKHKSVSTIAAILCGILLFFAASLTAFAQNGVRTAELELNPPADAVDAFTATGGGIFHFSFATGKTEWVPFMISRKMEPYRVCSCTSMIASFVLSTRRVSRECIRQLSRIQSPLLFHFAMASRNLGTTA